MSRPPIRVISTRVVNESLHLADAVIVGPEGVRESFGDAERATIPRSAIKSIQAVPLVRSGAAEAFGVVDEELALASSSHSSEPAHIRRVREWLVRIGCTEEDLECGAQRPIDVAAGDALVAAGTPFGRVHHCCSGKHTGFLTVARHLGVDTEGYLERSHPVQQLVEASIAEHTGVDLSAEQSGTDGCGIPTFAIPLRALAEGMRRLPTHDAGRRIVASLAANPWWVSGTGRAEVTLTADCQETLVLKTGAEGVFMAVLPERDIGIACKVHDGAVRAADVAIGALLAHVGVVADTHGSTVLRNAAGTVIGELRAHLD